MIKKILVFSICMLSFSYFFAEKSFALSSDDACSDVDVIFARGSGSPLNATVGERARFVEQVRERLGSAISMHTYELGTESYGNAKYPAVDVSNVWNGNAIGAAVSAGQSNDYGRSIALGKTELEGYLAKRAAKCPNERIILGGYSQGAQLMGEVHARLSNYASRIDFIALFGDPRLYLPEGEGLIPPACFGKNLSQYRRDIGNCRTDNGSLGARKPTYLVEGYHGKVGLWCNALDYVCGSSKMLYETSGHGKYAKSGGPIDRAALEIAERLKKTIKKEKVAAIDTTYRLGYGTMGNDVWFLVDAYHTMKTKYPALADTLYRRAKAIKENGGRATIGVYRAFMTRYEDGSMKPYTEPWVLSLRWHEDYDYTPEDTPLQADYPGYTERGNPLWAIYDIVENLGWEIGATKSVILITDDTTLQSPSPEGGTVDMLAKKLLAIDPVNVFPVVSPEAAGEFEELAQKTTGKVIIDTGDIETAVDKAVEAVNSRPVVTLKNTAYIAPMGQEITFDASQSYALGSQIVRYEWDFDGDNVYERTTTVPVTSYTYNGKFDGVMQVRATAANDTVANASATVQVGTYEPPVAAKAPINIKTTVKSPKTTVGVSWQSGDATTNRWIITVNGVELGMTEENRTSVEITNLDRSQENTISFTGVSPDARAGESISVIVAKDTSILPQGNWLDVLLACLKKVLQPLAPIFGW